MSWRKTLSVYKFKVKYMHIDNSIRELTDTPVIFSPNKYIKDSNFIEIYIVKRSH